jgi:arsenate reductase-like glutaredoxin family protein
MINKTEKAQLAAWIESLELDNRVILRCRKKAQKALDDCNNACAQQEMRIAKLARYIRNS